VRLTINETTAAAHNQFPIGRREGKRRDNVAIVRIGP
jgi:hypothetical protein